MVFASRKSRIKAPLHRRTEEIGACVADPFANGEGGERIDTFTIQKGAGGGCISPGVDLGTVGAAVNGRGGDATGARKPTGRADLQWTVDMAGRRSVIGSRGADRV